MIQTMNTIPSDSSMQDIPSDSSMQELSTDIILLLYTEKSLRST